MPGFPTHAMAGLALGAAFYRPGVPRRLWVTGAALAVAPDLDVIGFAFGVHYGSMLGHRGLTHSLAFAVATAAAVTCTWFRNGAGPLSRKAVGLYLALAMASHGLLDMLTDGGRGIALFAPFSAERLFWPVRPVAVAPIGVAGIFEERIFRVLGTEFLWIWIPAAVFVAIALRIRKN